MSSSPVSSSAPSPPATDNEEAPEESPTEDQLCLCDRFAAASRVSLHGDSAKHVAEDEDEDEDTDHWSLWLDDFTSGGRRLRRPLHPRRQQPRDLSHASSLSRLQIDFRCFVVSGLPTHQAAAATGGLFLS